MARDRVGIKTCARASVYRCVCVCVCVCVGECVYVLRVCLCICAQHVYKLSQSLLVTGHWLAHARIVKAVNHGTHNVCIRDLLITLN